jgi:uncharacterized protein YdiU (UPF0061 family)
MADDLSQCGLAFDLVRILAQTAMNSPDHPHPTSLRLTDLPLANRFASLPPAFYTELRPTPLPSPYLVCASQSAAALIGLETAELESPQFIAAFSGNAELPSSRPLSAVYSGHQFGVWAGQLGDGRAILLGETPAPSVSSGTLELQLKGAGKTPYSRMGDGRAVLRSSIREFLCSEAMAALGIPSTRALCVIGSDQPILRESIETAAVVTRMSPNFVRFGSFEHWFWNDRKDELKTLADYVIARSYPELAETAHPYQALLREVTRRSAELVAQWQAVGFMHGVLNTDNMSILGETLDYGPFGFMEAYDPAHICNHTDQQGRYAYRMQPRIVEWNCYALGQAILPLIGDVDAVHEALSIYQPTFDAKMSALWRAKLGLVSAHEKDDQLLQALLGILAANRVDFSVFFRRLSSLKRDDASADTTLTDLFIDRAALIAWLVEYRQRLALEESTDTVRQSAMNQVNPKFVLRNHLAHIAIEKAQHKDFTEVQRLLQILQHPFDEQPEHEHYAALPPDWAGELSVSCSS